MNRKPGAMAGPGMGHQAGATAEWGPSQPAVEAWLKQEMGTA